jgi:predicted metal-binding membrane protein
MTVNYLQPKTLKNNSTWAVKLLHFFIADELRWVWGIIFLAWTLILLAEIAGYGHLLHHNSLVDDSVPLIVKLLVFIGMWQVMIVAMMLPSSIPMLKLFARASSNQPQSQQVLFIFICAYATVWAGFAIALFGLDISLHQWDWLRETPWLYSGFTLAVAGAFQFSSLKQRCLQVCRHPLSFLTHHYQRGLLGAWKLGIYHGLYCLGCCWALMLVMFVVGTGHFTWMLLLSVAMTMERTRQNLWSIILVLGIVLLSTSSLAILHIDMLSRDRTLAQTPGD